jgi:hemerythrin HHE cation binding domain-containing protein
MNATVKEAPVHTEAVRQTIREHEDLRRHLAEIRQMVEAVTAIAAGRVAATDTGRQAAVRRLTAAIAEFQRLLAAHFSFEEKTGLPEELALRLPFVSDKARALRRDHVLILDELKALAASGRVATGPEEIAVYGGQVLHLVESVSGHEERETDLIQDAYLDETGEFD